uniref:Uncharacterized protein n=1 Tax=Ciona savignyi TaxID=51511 RepID=H2ZQ27_CIOSA
MFGRILTNETILPNWLTAALLRWKAKKETRDFSRVHTSAGIEYTGQIRDSAVDTIAPNQITDFTAVQNDIRNKTSGIKIRFTAPGDDEDIGTAESYNICYTFDGPTELLTNFEESYCVSNFSVPKTAGTIEEFIIPPPNFENRTGAIRVAIAIKAMDDALQVSRVSNIVSFNYFTGYPKHRPKQDQSIQSPSLRDGLMQDQLMQDQLVQSQHMNNISNTNASAALKCLTCYKARSHAECQRIGTVQLCMSNEQQCAIDIRTVNWRRKMITKYCKQASACINERQSNPTDCKIFGPNRFCRCCCGTSLCNVDESSCAGNV